MMCSKELALEEPLSDMTPEVNEGDPSDKSIEEIKKEVMESVMNLTKLTNENMKEFEKHNNPTDHEKGNIFEDGSNVTKLVKKKPDFMYHTLNKAKPLHMTIPNMIFFPQRPHMEIIPNHKEPVVNIEPMVTKTQQYEEDLFVLYRSKQKMMLATRDVYDVFIGGGFHIDHH